MLPEDGHPVQQGFSDHPVVALLSAGGTNRSSTRKMWILSHGKDVPLSASFRYRGTGDVPPERAAAKNPLSSSPGARPDGTYPQ